MVTLVAADVNPPSVTLSKVDVTKRDGHDRKKTDRCSDPKSSDCSKAKGGQHQLAHFRESTRHIHAPPPTPARLLSNHTDVAEIRYVTRLESFYGKLAQLCFPPRPL